MNAKDLFYEDIEVEDLFNDGDRDDPDYVPTTKKKMPKRGIIITQNPILHYLIGSFR